MILNLFPWIREQPYIAMLFQQCFNFTTYVRVVGKLVGTQFQCIFVLKSMRECPDSCWACCYSSPHLSALALKYFPWFQLVATSLSGYTWNTEQKNLSEKFATNGYVSIVLESYKKLHLAPS